MRFLFGFVGGRGHLEPLLPVARAASGLGHEVGFACAPTMLPAVEAAGFAGFGVGPAGPAAPVRLPLRAPDPEREVRELRERFVERAARARLPHVLELARHWRPDCLVCDETDFGAALAAERAGVPFATVVTLAAGGFLRAEAIGPALDRLRAEHRLPSDPELRAAGRHVVLAPFPPAFRDPRFPLPGTAFFFRPAPPRPPPARPSPGRSKPRVYVTLGTVFGLESGDLLARLVAALRELPVDLVVTVGPDIDPAELGPQPDAVRVERYRPQDEILPRCRAVLSHGGSGSVLGALRHGLPSLLLPLGADQPLNAARCEVLGVASVADPMTFTPESIREALTQLLGDSPLRRSAGAFREAFAALPDAARAVERLEQCALAR